MCVILALPFVVICYAVIEKPIVTPNLENHPFGFHLHKKNHSRGSLSRSQENGESVLSSLSSSSCDVNGFVHDHYLRPRVTFASNRWH